MSDALLLRALVPGAQAWLEDRIDEGRLFTGAQVAVVHQGTVIADLAIGRDGSGRAVEVDTQFRIYCAAKPLLAAAVCNAAGRGQLELHAPLAAFQPNASAAVGQVHLDALLHHQTPFTEPTGFGSAFVPSGSRARAVQVACESAIRLGRRDGYGEVANWLLLSEALAWSTGRAWTSLVFDYANEAGLAIEELSISSDAVLRNHRDGLVGLNVSMRNGRLLPLLGEVDRSLSERIDGPGFGAASSTRFLTRFLYDAVVRRGYGTVGRARTLRDDPAYGRDLRFADGLMVGPETLGVSDLWPDDVAGHSGIGGMTLAFASPKLDLAVGIHLNGLMAPADGRDHVRPALTSLLHGELVQGLGLGPA